MFAEPSAFDLKFFTLANQHWRNDFFDILMPLISSKAVFFTVVCLAMLVLWRKKGARSLIPVLVILATLGCTDFFGNFIKKSVERVRPLNAIANTWHVDNGQWKQRPADFVQTKKKGRSFPSSHSANMMALAVLTMAFWRKTRPWALILPLAVGYSRLYLGKHYPLDVLGGYLWGAAVAAICWTIWKKLLEPRLCGTPE